MCQAPQPALTLKRVVGFGYPWFARMAALQGTVELIAIISLDGSVAKVDVKSGAEPLASPAKEALSKWQLAGCHSVAATCEAKFISRFILSGSCNAAAHCPTGFEVDMPGEVTVTAKAIKAIMN
jgi:hypothetical protein